VTQVSLRAAVAAATDEELLTLPGVFKSTLSKVRAWADGESVEPTPERPLAQSHRATAVDPTKAPRDAVGGVTTETVKEEPLRTTETVKTDVKAK
jgi:hypothetical protein